MKLPIFLKPKTSVSLTVSTTVRCCPMQNKENSLRFLRFLAWTWRTGVLSTAWLALFHRLLITETQEDCSPGEVQSCEPSVPTRSAREWRRGGRSGRTQLRPDHSDRTTNWKYRHYPARSTGCCRLSPTSILRLTGRYLIVRRLEMQQRCPNKTKLLLYTHPTALLATLLGHCSMFNTKTKIELL